MRDAIVAATPATTCNAVADTHLAAIGALDLTGEGIGSLRRQDFAGLTGMHTLVLHNNSLDHLPADLFEDLDGLTTKLVLFGNDLTTLTPGVFDSLTRLGQLDLRNNGLSALPAGIFDELSGLKQLWLSGNALGSIGNGVFASTRLTLLWLDGNGLARLPAGAFEGLGALTELRLNGNSFSSLPADVFAGLGALTELRLQDNSLSSLPDNVFQPLTLMTSLRLEDNPGFDRFVPAVTIAVPAQTVGREGGVRVELEAIGGPSPWGTNVNWSWAQTDSSGETVTLNGASFRTAYFTTPASSAEDTELTFEATATGKGTGGRADPREASATAAVTVEGAPGITDVSVTSRPGDGTDTFKRGERIEITVTFDEPVEARYPGADKLRIKVNRRAQNGDVSPVRWDYPYARQDHPRKLIFSREVALVDSSASGFCIGASCEDDQIRVRGNARIVATADDVDANRSFSKKVTAYKIQGAETAPSGGVCTRHHAVRDALVAATTATACGGVTNALLAAVTSLDLSGESIDSLRRQDFAGLSGLTSLDLSGNDLDYLPGDLFDSLTALTSLDLRNNALQALPDGVFQPLTQLTSLTLGDNPGSGTFVPAVSATGPQTAQGGDRVTLEATVEPNPWGTNLEWSWAVVTGLGVTFENADTATASFVAPGIGEDTAQTYRVTAKGRGASAAATADVTLTLEAGPVLSALRLTSRPADGTTFRRGEAIEISASFTRPVEAVNSPETNVYVELSADEEQGGSTTTAELKARYHRQDDPEKLVFRLVVDASTPVENTGGFWIGDSGGRPIKLLNDGMIVASGGGAAAGLLLDWFQTSYNIDGSVAGPTGGVCARQYQVRDALVAAVAGVTSCADVTGAHLRAIGSLDVSGTNIRSLRGEDLAGLSGLTSLDLSDNRLGHLPGDLFAGLAALEVLDLSENALTAPLSDGVFAGLGAIVTLDLGGNPGFDDFVPAVSIPVASRSAREGDRVELAAEAGPSPWGQNVTWSWAQTDSSGKRVALEGAMSRTVGFTAPRVGADTALTFEATATGRGTGSNASPSTAAATATVTVEPDAVTGLAIVTKPANGTAYGAGERIEIAATFTRAVAIRGMPEIRLDMGGEDREARYESGAGTSLLLFAYTVKDTDSDADGVSVAANSFVLDSGAGDMIRNLHGGDAVLDHDAVAADLAHAVDGTASPPTGGICGRTAQVRDALVALVMDPPGVTDCSDVTDAHLGAITGNLALGSSGIAALKDGDFEGLGAVTTLSMDSNGLTELPAGVFGPLTGVSTLTLAGNALSSLPARVFDGLAALRVLNLKSNALTALPDGVFEPLGRLAELDLSGNPGFDTFHPVAHAGEDLPAAEAGAIVTLDGTASAGGPWGTNVSYAWTVDAGSAVAPTLTWADTARPTFPAPALAEGAELVLALKVSGKGGQGSFYTSTDTVRVPVAPAPAIAAVAVISSPRSGVAYGAGEAIEIGVTFSRAVEVTGTPPGVTARTVDIRVLDDAHDEGREVMLLYLHNATGATIADAVAKGTIENSDPMPAAWLARFGRTVADQVIEAVEGRVRASRQAGFEARLAGQRIGGPGSKAPDEVMREAEAQAGVEAMADWLRGGTEEDGPGAYDGDGGLRPGESRAVTERDLLTGSSFALTAGTDSGGFATLWGAGAVSRFNGRQDDLSLDGEVATGMLGADWSRGSGSGAGDWTAGMLIAHSRGSGDYRSPERGGSVESSLTGLYPWGRYAVNERLSVWGIAGYGSGNLTLTPKDRKPLETDMDLMMGAAGLRGVVVEAPADGGPELAVTSDALIVGTSSAAIPGLAAAEAEVTRLRLGLEGSYLFRFGEDATLTPRLEIGVRHDGGDAETGFGSDIGAGLEWSDRKRGIEAEVSGRGLLSHDDGGFRERGFAGSLTFDPRPDTERGLKVTLQQTVGASATGGMDALLGRETLSGLAANDNGDDDLQRRRLELKLGYGLSAFGDRFTAVPEIGLALSDSDREVSLGWRLGFARGRSGRGSTSLELGVEATRREFANDDREPEHAIGFRLRARW